MFEERDVDPDDRPRIQSGAGVRFSCMNTMGGTVATEVQILHADSKCPCGSGAMWIECCGNQTGVRPLLRRQMP